MPLDTLLARHARYYPEKVAVVLHAGATSSCEAIVAWVNERVSARFQKIGDVTILDAFPRSVAGKTLRRVIKQSYTEGEAT